MGKRIEFKVYDGIADVKLVRSDKMNALDDAMFSALIETGDTLAADRSIRAVVLSGEGRAFCAGLDMANFGRMASGDNSKSSSSDQGAETLTARSYGIANRGQYAVWTWREVPVPVIAAVHGVAFGGGFQLMLGSDIRIVHPATKLSVMEIKWGLIPDMAGTAIMRNLARDDLVRELTYTGRQFSGNEALEMGFATHVSENPLDDALALAKEIAGKNPDAICAAKKIFNSTAELSEAELLQQEAVLQESIIRSPNQVEAVLATMEKRAPTFAKRT